MAQIIEVFKAQQVKKQKQRDELAEVEAAPRLLRVNEMERMPLQKAQIS
jgi:hypothetical protein